MSNLINAVLTVASERQVQLIAKLSKELALEVTPVAKNKNDASRIIGQLIDMQKSVGRPTEAMLNRITDIERFGLCRVPNIENLTFDRASKLIAHYSTALKDFNDRASLKQVIYLQKLHKKKDTTISLMELSLLSKDTASELITTMEAETVDTTNNAGLFVGTYKDSDRGVRETSVVWTDFDAVLQSKLYARLCVELGGFESDEYEYSKLEDAITFYSITDFDAMIDIVDEVANG